MHKKGILVSTFIVPKQEQIVASAETDCDAIELHTGMYANAKTERVAKKRLAELALARDIGIEHKLVVHAGHGLTYRNIAPVASLEGLCEFNIGHSIIARAVLVGMRQATREMIDRISKRSA
jgi:pyridoxine 5-phosphate synthase